MRREREGRLAWQSPSTAALPRARSSPQGPGKALPAVPRGEGKRHQPTLLNHAIVGLFPTFGGSIVFRIILLLLAQVTAEPNDRDERVK